MGCVGQALKYDWHPWRNGRHLPRCGARVQCGIWSTTSTCDWVGAEYQPWHSWPATGLGLGAEEVSTRGGDSTLQAGVVQHPRVGADHVLVYQPHPVHMEEGACRWRCIFRSGKVVLQEIDCQLSYLHFPAGKLLSKINQNPSTKPSLRRHGVPDLLVPCSCHRAARRRTSLLHPPRPRAPHLLHLSEGRRAYLLGKHHWHQRLVEVSLESHEVSGHIHLLNWTPSLLIKAGMLSLNNHFLR